MKKKNSDIVKEYPRKQFIAKLRRLADVLEAGNTFRIQIGNESMYIPGYVFVNIEHERQKIVKSWSFNWKGKKSNTSQLTMNKMLVSNWNETAQLVEKKNRTNR